MESEASHSRSSPGRAAVPPASNYKDKYKHLLGEESGKMAARATKSNVAYGVGK